MPHLLHVSQTYRPVGGGQEVYITNLNRMVSANGWTTAVIQPNRGERGADTLLVPRVKLVPRYFPFFDDLQFALFTILFRRHALSRADLILCHYATTAGIFGRMKSFRGKTIVLSHGVEWNVDRMNRHDRIREWNARCLLSSLPTVANDTDYFRRMGLNIPPGQNFFGQVGARQWFIPNCVDTETFSPDANEKPMWSFPAVLVPRQICADRGIHLAIDAFSVMAQRHPTCKLVIVGPVREKAYFANCMATVVQRGLQDRVMHLPPVSNAEMIKYYRSAALTLIPTLRREGTSLSALESMACGTATVVTDVAGLKDLPAFRSKPTPEALANSIERALSDRQALAQSQLKAIRSTFNFHNWAEGWKNVFGDLLSTRAS